MCPARPRYEGRTIYIVQVDEAETFIISITLGEKINKIHPRKVDSSCACFTHNATAGARRFVTMYMHSAVAYVIMNHSAHE